MSTVRELQAALAANSTATSFSAKIPTVTQPTGAGVWDLLDASNRNKDGGTAKYVQLIPYGTDANNETFDMRLWGWNKTADATPVWIPQLLLEVQCTLGNIDAAAIAASHFMVDTIVIVEGDTAGAEGLINTAADTPASILVRLRGVELIEFAFDLTGGAAANCLWRTLDE